MFQINPLNRTIILQCIPSSVIARIHTWAPQQWVDTQGHKYQPEQFWIEDDFNNLQDSFYLGFFLNRDIFECREYITKKKKMFNMQSADAKVLIFNNSMLHPRMSKKTKTGPPPIPSIFPFKHLFKVELLSRYMTSYSTKTAYNSHLSQPLTTA